MKNKKTDKRRVVVTGLGVVSSIGIGFEEFWKNLILGKSGISKIEAFDTSEYPIHMGGEVKNLVIDKFIDKRILSHFGRTSRFAVTAAKIAIQSANLNKNDLGLSSVLLGTTLGESSIIEEMNAILAKNDHQGIIVEKIPMYPSNNISLNVALEFKSKSYNFMFPTACAAGNYSIGYAYDLIAYENAQVVLAGGAEAFSRTAFTGFNRLYAMASEKCQPFDKNRKGMMLGEGAGVLVLESLEHAQKRSAKIYAEVLGYGLSCDAHHMTQPSEEGIAKCIEKAIKESGILKEDVDYISAHGTGTPQNDKAECAAFRKVFGEKAKTIPTSSIKSMLGHTMGAASAIEAVACCLSIRDNILPPTINFETADEDCDVDCVPNKSRRVKNVKIVLNNASAFGGNNACVIFKSFEL